MRIIEQIGSYAGLGAVVGLAVLAALYFSQARDVKRLREWAGRAPDRAAPPMPSQVVARPVPRPPPPQTPAAGAPRVPAPGVPQPPQPAPARPATAGAGPEVATRDTKAHPPNSPPLAPPPAPPPGLGGHFAREAQLAGEREAAGGDGSPPANGGREGDELHDEELEETPSAPNGGPEADGPAHTGPDEEGVHDEEDRLGDDLHDADDPDADLHDDALDEDEIPDERDLDEDALDEDEIPDERDLDEDALERRPVAGAGQREPGPALSPPARAPISPPPATAARAPLPPRPVPPRRPPQGPILPPYEKSRPGGPNLDREGPSRRARLLALGGGALAIAVVAFGVVQLVGGGDAAEDPAPQAPVSQPGGSAPTAGDPAAGATIVPGDVTVAVLNGTSVAGLAAGLGDRLESEGFNLGNITNSADQERAESVVLYATGAEEEARDVGRRLRINQREPIDPETQTRAGDASVVVVVGADLDR